MGSLDLKFDQLTNNHFNFCWRFGVDVFKINSLKEISPAIEETLLNDFFNKLAFLVSFSDAIQSASLLQLASLSKSWENLSVFRDLISLSNIYDTGYPRFLSKNKKNRSLFSLILLHLKSVRSSSFWTCKSSFWTNMLSNFSEESTSSPSVCCKSNFC